jgi:3-carboxy-cis,cis-muconate cycloisomerase
VWARHPSTGSEQHADPDPDRQGTAVTADVSTTTLDCALLRDLYGKAEMRSVFDTRALVQGWLDAERALASAEAAVGVIPVWAAERIDSEANADRFDIDALRAGIAASQHPLVPLIRALAERCETAGGYVHWGATTQDIIDTGMVLQIQRAVGMLVDDLTRCVTAARTLAGSHRSTLMAGRTHGQHAVPISFGLKAASWADELDRAASRLADAGRDAACIQLGGAAGTLAALGTDAGAVRAEFAAKLGLAEPAVPWHASRDRIRGVGNALRELAAVGERIAAEIVRLQSTEVAEVAEPAGPGHVGSSTMPQKRNPMTCEYVIATARLLRGAVSVLDDAPAHAGERDMGAWAAEWIAVPQAFILASGIARDVAGVLEQLEVDTDRMRRNLALTNGAIMAEAAMMALASALGHEVAHQIVGEASAQALRERRTLIDVLASMPIVTAAIDADQLRALMHPDRYLGLAAVIADHAANRPNVG